MSLSLGCFSVSLSCKDVVASLAFYEALDFKQVAGDVSKGWAVVQSGSTTIGLFRAGMLEPNVTTLTFNPGWAPRVGGGPHETLAEFQDVRDLQQIVKARGLAPLVEADTTTDGPAHLVLADPDGNRILIDQHVPKPKTS